jgi:hypothetical protein
VFTTLKTEVMAPMPKAMVKRAVKVNPGDLSKERMLIRRFRSKACMESPFDTSTSIEEARVRPKDPWGRNNLFS